MKSQQQNVNKKAKKIKRIVKKQKQNKKKNKSTRPNDKTLKEKKNNITTTEYILFNKHEINTSKKQAKLFNNR